MSVSGLGRGEVVLAPPSGELQRPEFRRLALGWLLLALASLVLAGVYAFLAAMTRTPAVRLLPGAEYFQTSLIGHVTFSLTVWLLSFIALLWVLLQGWQGAPLNGRVGWLGLGLAVGGFWAIALSAFMGWGKPVLVDYLPFLKHPAFIGGLGAFLAGIGVTAVNFLISLFKSGRPLSLATIALRYTALAYLMVLVVLLLSLARWSGGDYANLVWGPGHLLQVVNASAMVGVWLLLGLGLSLSKSRQRLLGAVLPIFLLPGLIIPWLYLLPTAAPRGAMGNATWIGLGIPTIAVGLTMLWALIAQGKAARPGQQSLAPLLLSMGLFGIGVVIASLGLESDTRVPAHYHGAIGSVTVAFMGMAYKLLPALGLRWEGNRRLAKLQPYLYSAGLFLLILGLFWAGSFGAPRKAFETFTTEPALLAAMNLMGMGALVAVAGGAAFVWLMGSSLWARQQSTYPKR